MDAAPLPPSCAPEGFVQQTLGHVPTSRNVTTVDGVVSFAPLPNLSAHYIEHCRQPRALTRSEQVSVVNQYTADWYCTEVNLALASDDLPSLMKNGQYIADLNQSMLRLGQPLSGVVFRGVDLSDDELQAMSSMGTFFLPSFTSATSEMDVAMSGAFQKNCILIIDVSDAFGLPMTEELSMYAEQEVLLPCYTQVQFTNKVITPEALTVVHLKVLPNSAKGAQADVSEFQTNAWCGVWTVTLQGKEELVVIQVEKGQLVSRKLEGNASVQADKIHWMAASGQNPEIGSTVHGKVCFGNGKEEWWFPDVIPPGLTRESLGSVYTLTFVNAITIRNHKGTTYRKVRS